ncbi:MAG TPA: hypothetical protein VFO65_12015, partial [Acidimicrobiales bacterium]|nr:hypothetical protein [Acidimicrobiales bacterium]
MGTLSRFGISCVLPPGWEGAIYRRPPEAGEDTHPVVQLGTFALPAGRGDFGNGAVDVMGPGDVLMVLLEYAPASAGTALFAAEGLPPALAVDDFS